MMQIKKRFLPALALSLAALTAAPEAAAQSQFSNVYVFGDSLSDAGYFRPLLAGLGVPSSLVSQLGRFTTNPGPVWSEIVANYYGYSANPSNVSGGNIFAQGGARVALDGSPLPAPFTQRPVSAQIGEYLTRSGGTADPNALYFVWAGGNDFLANNTAFAAGQITQAQLQANVLAAASAEVQQIGRLRAAGARYIAVFTLPDIGMAPAVLASGAAASAGATALSAGYNTTLFTTLAGAGIRVIPIDVFALMQEFRANPAQFGFTNTTGVACGPFPPFSSGSNSQFCLVGSNLVAAGAQNSYLFADPIHPTSGAHRVIANFVEAMIDGPTQYSLLAETALRSRAGHAQAISDGILTAKTSEVGRWTVFGGAERSEFDVQAGGATTGVDSTSNTGTVGLAVRVSDGVTLGAAYGHNRMRGGFGENRGGFRATDHIWSVFGSARWKGFYGSAVLSVADTTYNLQRDFMLGIAARSATATAEGSNSSGQLTLGYDFPLGRFTIGPTVSVTSQNVDVNGFDEAGGGSAGLRIAAQKRRSEVWSGGARASFDLGRWTPWLRVTADKERRDDVRYVTATPLSMVSIGSSYDIPAYQSDTTFTTVALGINGMVTDRVGVSIAGFKVSGRSGIDESGVNAMLSVRF